MLLVNSILLFKIIKYSLYNSVVVQLSNAPIGINPSVQTL